MVVKNQYKNKRLFPDLLSEYLYKQYILNKYKATETFKPWIDEPMFFIDYIKTILKDYPEDFQLKPLLVRLKNENLPFEPDNISILFKDGKKYVYLNETNKINSKIKKKVKVEKPKLNIKGHTRDSLVKVINKLKAKYPDYEHRRIKNLTEYQLNLTTKEYNLLINDI